LGYNLPVKAFHEGHINPVDMGVPRIFSKMIGPPDVNFETRIDIV
jgi:hypothetical protein